VAECKLNGYEVVSATISMPLHGVWTAIVECNTDTALTGRCVLDCNGVEFNGTVRRSGVYQNTLSVWISGGTNGLKNAISGLQYSNVPASIPLNDAMLVADSQALSTTADAASLSTFWTKWVRLGGTVAEELKSITDELDANWRILRDGTLWIGQDTYSALTVDGAIQLHDAAYGCIAVSTDTPCLYPGVTWNGYRLSYVTHRIYPSKSITEAWYE
jgi:hypothetical protein